MSALVVTEEYHGDRYRPGRDYTVTVVDCEICCAHGEYVETEQAEATSRFLVAHPLCKDEHETDPRFAGLRSATAEEARGG